MALTEQEAIGAKLSGIGVPMDRVFWL